MIPPPPRSTLFPYTTLFRSEVQFAPDSRLSERVLFPVSPSQSNGIEDARFVHFKNDNGTKTYCATYTAYDRSEEHTSELQSHSDLVCRLLLEKKKKTEHGSA